MLTEDIATNAELRIKVLIVDDNHDSAASLAMLVETWGCKTQTAGTGQAALDSATAELPDFVLLDIGLPDFDGFEVAKQLRQTPDMKHTRIVAISGYGQPSAANSIDDLFDAYLIKPVDLPKLKALIAHGGRSQ